MLGLHWARGVRTSHARVQWHHGPEFSELLEQETEAAREALKKYGRLVLLGASAGGSLTVNVFHEVRRADPNADIYGITLSAWLRVGDPAALEQAAMVRARRGPSPSFMHSVEHCDQTAVPGLSEADKVRLLTGIPPHDQTVPTDCMDIAGVEVWDIPVEGHIPSIAYGALHAHVAIDELVA